MNAETKALLGITKIVLGGGKEIEVQKKSIVENKRFRVELSKHFKKITDEFSDSGKEFSLEAFGLFIIPYFTDEGLDVLVELPFLYEETLEQYRQGTTDDEYVDAGLEILTITLPFFLNTFKKVLAKIALMKALATEKN